MPTLVEARNEFTGTGLRMFDEKHSRVVSAQGGWSGTLRFCLSLALVVVVFVSGGLYLSAVRLSDLDGSLLDAIDLRSWTADRTKRAELFSRWNIEPLPQDLVSRSRKISSNLETLIREPCDWNAVYELSEALQEAFYRREAAEVLISYSDTCRPSTTSLYTAATIFQSLSDFDRALVTTEKLISVSGEMPDEHFLRARVLADVGRHEEAIASFHSTVELAHIKEAISSSVFYLMSKSYEALGDYCGAIAPVHTWLSLNPANANNRHAHSIIASLSTKGNCSTSYARGEDTFATQGDDVIFATVSVNGVSGTFVVDTGASFVTLSGDFAERAQVQTTAHQIKMQTANGIATAQRATLSNVQIGKVEAQGVAAVVHSKDHPKIEGIDGLLGRSFLARFNITFSKNEWRIGSKNDL